MSKRKAVETACLLCLFLFAGFLCVQRASAAPNPSSAFLINPSSLTVSVNTNFTVIVSLTNAQYLDAWQVILKYNGTCLRLNKLWVPPDNVFAGHTIEVTPSRFNYTDAIDGSNSCMIGACTMGSDYVNVSNGAVLSANFAVLSAGQWSIEVADKSNPLHESRSADCSFWLNTTSMSSHDALGSNCTVLGVNETVVGPKIGTIWPLNSTFFLSLENFTISSTSNVSSLSFDPSISELSFDANVCAFDIMNITLPSTIVENTSLAVTISEDGQSMPHYTFGPPTVWSVCPDQGLHAFKLDIDWIDPPPSIPEFSLPTILLLLVMLTMLTFTLHQKRVRSRTERVS